MAFNKNLFKILEIQMCHETDEEITEILINLITSRFADIEWKVQIR